MLQGLDRKNSILCEMLLESFVKYSTARIVKEVAKDVKLSAISLIRELKVYITV